MARNLQPGQIAPFPAWSVTLPPSLPFPRDLYAEALDEHARLLALYTERLLRLVRDAARSELPYTEVIDLVGIVVAGRDGRPDDVRVERRGDAAFEVCRYRAVLSPLLLRPDPPRLFLVVAARGVISLHGARIDRSGLAEGKLRSVLVVEPGEIAFEPLALKHFDGGKGPWMVTRWKHPDGDPRWAWVPVPPEPATDDDAVDRILAHLEERIRRKLWALLEKRGAACEPMVVIVSMRELGDGLHVVDRRTTSALSDMHPEIVRAIRERSTPGRVPVWVGMDRTAGLRWFELRPGQEADEPLRLVEDFRMPVYADEPSADPDPAPAAKRVLKPRRKPDPVEAWDIIMSGGTNATINLKLLKMTSEELDQEIAKVGFDPSVERATIWLCESVIDAMDRQWWAEEDARAGLIKPPEPSGHRLRGE